MFCQVFLTNLFESAFYTGIIDNMKFKDLLREYREARHLSKTFLAKRLGKTPSYIMLIESGHRKPPSLSMVKLISGILHLNTLEESQLILTAAKERTPEPERVVYEDHMLRAISTNMKFSNEILDALKDPIAVKALLVTHKNSEDIKVAIRHMLDCLPTLSIEKRQAILALCK